MPVPASTTRPDETNDSVSNTRGPWPDGVLAKDALDRLYAQKYGPTPGLGPRRRYAAGYFQPEDHYEAVIASLVREGCTWLDIGGGHHLFPNNPGLARALASRCQAVVAVDPSETVHQNPFATDRHQSRAEDFASAQPFDLVTLRMVAEHIEDPSALVATLARTVAPGGAVVIFTVHKWAPIALVAGAVPFALHYPIKRRFWGGDPEDTFPTCYQMNTRATLQRQMAAGGFYEAQFAYLDDLSTWSQFRTMGAIELAAWRAWRRTCLPYPEHCLLGVYRRA